MVRRELDTALSRAQVEATRRYDIALVMTEAAGNAVLHAYPPLPPGLLFVDAAVTGRNLLLRVCDCGRGIQPRADRPGLGLGLSMMAQLADGLEISRNRAVSGTRVSAMFRDVTPAGGPQGPHRVARRNELEEYVAALRAADGTGDDAEALLAVARQALDRADRLRAERHL